MSLLTFIDPAAITEAGRSSLALKEVALAFIPLTSVALSLRMYVRIFIVKGFGLDDIFLLVAQAFFLVFCAIAIKLINLEHDPSMIKAFTGDAKTAFAAIESIYTDSILFAVFYVFTVVFLKISLAFFYLRIVIQQWQRVVIYITATTMTLFGLAYSFTYLFRCGSDVNHQLVYRTAGKCAPDHTMLVLTYIFGALDTMTDFIYAFLPIYILWNSNMPLGMKFTAGFLLCIGSVSSICALVRTATLSNLTLDAKFFKQAVQTGLWSIIEPGLAIVAASLAACRPLWRKVSESSSTGSLIRNTFMFRWSSSKRSGISSGSIQTRSGQTASRPSGLGFVERTEANRGFKKFNDVEYGVSTATVIVGDEREMTELQDLGRLEAQDDFREEDESEKSLVRASMPPSEHQSRSKIFKTRDVRVDVRTAP